MLRDFFTYYWLYQLFALTCREMHRLHRAHAHLICTAIAAHRLRCFCNSTEFWCHASRTTPRPPRLTTPFTYSRRHLELAWHELSVFSHAFLALGIAPVNCDLRRILRSSASDFGHFSLLSISLHRTPGPPLATLANYITYYRSFAVAFHIGNWRTSPSRHCSISIRIRSSGARKRQLLPTISRHAVVIFTG
jgi:hypothetical protein